MISSRTFPAMAPPNRIPSGLRRLRRSLRRFHDLDLPVHLRTAHRLRGAGGPEDFDGVDLLGFAEAEVERDQALGEVAGLAVVPLRVGLAAGCHAHLGAEAVAVRLRSPQLDLEIPEAGVLLGQVA